MATKEQRRFRLPQNMKKIIFAGLLAALFLACHKDFDNTTVTQTGPIPTVNIQASLYGRVLTTAGMVVSGAEVKVAGQTLTTNAQGLFFVYNQQLDHNGTYAQVKAPGYFSTGRFAHPHLGSSTYMEVVLMEKTSQQFSANSTATIPVSGGGSVTIPAQSLVTADGQAYSGTFLAATHWLDPSDNKTFSTMPGDLRAEDAEGRAKVLKTFGMVGVELATPAGVSLNLASDKKATVSLPIPASISSNAPNNISLWHFDESNGYWKEEGSATKQGSNYVGEVAHFSFWNCDVPGDYIILNGCLGNANGNPLGNTWVNLTSPNYGNGYAYTDAEGRFGGVVPANELLNLKIHNSCGAVIYSTMIGPFSVNTTLSKININNTTQTTLSVSGTLVDCNGVPLTSGLVCIQDSVFAVVPTDSSGHFETTIYTCSSITALNLRAYNVVNPSQSVPLVVNVVGGVANAGTIPVCSALDEYVTVQLNGQTNTYFLYPEFLSTASEGYLGASTQDSTYVRLAFQRDSATMGPTTVRFLEGAYVNPAGYHSFGCEYCPSSSCLCDPTDTENVIFTNFPLTPGQYAIGSASGSVWDNDNAALLPYTLSFRLKKIY